MYAGLEKQMDKPMKLRQIAVAAHNLASSRDAFMSLVDAPGDFTDPGVSEFGLANSVITLGNSFFEIVSPTEPETAVGRMLIRQKRDCGYMLLLQANAIEPVSERVESMRIRKIWETERPEVSAFHLHPKDVGGAIVSIDQMRPPESWLWAGPDWEVNRSRLVGDLRSVSIEVDDAGTTASRWSSLLDVPCRIDGDSIVLDLEDGQTICFLSKPGGLPRGLCVAEWRWLGSLGAMPAPQIFCGVQLIFSRAD